ncbi:HNH endonuclease domain-containing protein [Yersinia phage vB_YenS_P400]|nr:HNH endonuclease domain-containing protein [Yersinia phage vB_YenS_P400]
MQTCKSCNETKSINEFYKSTKTLSGYRGVCIQCSLINSAENIKKNRNLVGLKVSGGGVSRIDIPSAEELNYLFTYDGKDLIRNYPAGNRKAGMIATRSHSRGYLCVNVNGVRYLAHRIIWMMVFGSVPDYLDHKNRDKKDNQLSNIRASNGIDNRSNTDIMANNTTGLIGVYWYNYKGIPRWRAACNDKHLGYHLNVISAVKAYNAYASEKYGHHAIIKIEHNKRMIKERFNAEL